MPAHTQILWVPDEERAYARAELYKGEKLADGKIVKVRLTNSGRVVEVASSDVLMTSLDEEDEHKTTDLTKLPDLNHAALLQSLDSRFEHDEIYTLTGKILIAVNPFKLIKKMYDKKMKDRFLKLSVTDKMELPHVYGVAHQAYISMRENKGRNQSVLVSGESGAGKTETTKKVMDYLTTISMATSKANGSAEICDRVLQTNPLLEAFGNAKTVRNDNSSRFGKLIQMQFEPGKLNLIGATIDTYLLEKGRVTHQSGGERNYHIFYELDAGATSQQKKSWNMPALKSCRYTNQSGVYARDDIDDDAQFKFTLKAMDVVGVTQEERERVFSTVVAVLHMGNIRFDATDGGEGSKISDDTMASAQMCADLLDVQVDKLNSALCTRAISAGTTFLAQLAQRSADSVMKKHTVDQANDARDALAKTLYERLFLWLVWRVNSSISETGEDQKKRLSLKLGRGGKKGGKKKGAATEPTYINDFSIGCLDIFGFEVFEHNSFEQLCINYANEMLQQQFNEFVFTLEQQIYEDEGIDWKQIEFPDNKECIDLIEAKPIGLLRLIDEECMYPQGTDTTLHQKLAARLPPKFPRFTVDSITQKKELKFSIRHFAGPVEYSVPGFYDKNKNELRQEAVDLMRSSNDELVKILLPADAAQGKAASLDYFEQLSKKSNNRRRSHLRGSFERRRGDASQKIQQRTVGTQFKEQLALALKHIRASEPHYVRCIKPNDVNRKEIFDRPRVLEQLNYSGVLEVVRVARAGYASRFLLKDFVERFISLAQRRPKSRTKSEMLAASQSICESTSLRKLEDYQIGYTKVFLRSDAYTKLERLKAVALTAYAIKIQRAFRKWAIINRGRMAERAAEKKRREQERAAAEAKRIEEERIRREKEEAEAKAAAEAARLEAERLRLEEERRQKLELERIRMEAERLELERLKREAEEAERLRKLKEEAERLKQEKERKEAERKLKEQMEKARREKEAREALLRKQLDATIKIQSFARMVIGMRALQNLYDEEEEYEHKMQLLEQQRMILSGELFENDSDSDSSSDEDDDDENDPLDLQSLYITGGAGGLLFLLIFPKLTMYLLFASLCIGGGGMLALEMQKSRPKRGGRKHKSREEEMWQREFDEAPEHAPKPKKMRKRDKFIQKVSSKISRRSGKKKQKVY